MSELIDIPVTRDLRTQIGDMVGVLRIPEIVADELAVTLINSADGEEPGCKLYGSVQHVDGQWKLRNVSFGGVPCRPESEKPPPKPKSPPIEVIRNDQTMTTQARIARRFRVVTNGEKFAVQYRRRWWHRWLCRGRLDQGRVQVWEYDTAIEARAVRGRLIQNAYEAARKWVPVREVKQRRPPCGLEPPSELSPPPPPPPPPPLR